VLLAIVGLSSGIYHCTLSLAGQLLDEVSIIWVFLSVYAFVLPKSNWLHFYPVLGRRWVWWRFWIVVGCVLTLVGWLYPVANAFFLLIVSIPFVVFACIFCYVIKCQRLRRLGFASVMWWTIAIVLWAIDRLWCDELSTHLFDLENEYERQIQEYVQLHAA